MAAKLRDGLFIGDADASLDAEFLDLNKISHIVNVASREVPNKWAAHGVAYMCFPWIDNPECVLFEHSLRSLTDLVEFVDDANRHGQCVLVCSVRGQGRAAVACVASLMYKYRWSFEKAYDFVVSKKADIDINRGFVHQLFILDKRLVAARKNYRVGTCKTDVLIPTSSQGASGSAASNASEVAIAASAWGLPVFAPIVFKTPAPAQSRELEDSTKAGGGAANISGVDDDTVDWRAVEAQRRDGWDAQYVRACQAFVRRRGVVIHESGTTAPLSKVMYDKLYTFALDQVSEDLSEELLMISSYTNGKVTLSSLPGPYPEASREVKPFSIRFNPDLYLHHLFEEPDGRFVSMVTRSSGKVHSPLPPSPSEADNRVAVPTGDTSSSGQMLRAYSTENNEDHPSRKLQPRFGVLKGGKTHDSMRRVSGAGVRMQSQRTSSSSSSERVADSDRSARGTIPAAASAEQRLHSLLSGLQFKGDPSSSASNQVRQSSEPSHPIRADRSDSKHLGAKQSGHRDGELTDTSSEDEDKEPGRVRRYGRGAEQPDKSSGVAEPKSFPREPAFASKDADRLVAKSQADGSALSLLDIASMRLEPAFNLQANSIVSIDGGDDASNEVELSGGSRDGTTSSSMWRHSDRKMSAFDQHAPLTEAPKRPLAAVNLSTTAAPTNTHNDFISKSLLRAKLLADDAIGKSGKTLQEEQQLRADALKLHDKKLAWTLSNNTMSNDGQKRPGFDAKTLNNKNVEPFYLTDPNGGLEISKGKPVRVSHSRFSLEAANPADRAAHQPGAMSSRSPPWVSNTSLPDAATTDTAVYRHGSPAAVRMSPRKAPSSSSSISGVGEGRTHVASRDKLFASRQDSHSSATKPGSIHERDKRAGPDSEKAFIPHSVSSSRSHGTPQRERPSSGSGATSSGLSSSSRTSVYSVESTASFQGGAGAIPARGSSTPTRSRGDAAAASSTPLAAANRRPSTPTRAWR